MIFPSSKLFSNVLARLRGAKTKAKEIETRRRASSHESRRRTSSHERPDSLYPLRKAFRQQEAKDGLVDLKSKLRKVPRKIMVREDQTTSHIGGGSLLTPQAVEFTPSMDLKPSGGSIRSPIAPELTPSADIPETYFDKVLTNHSDSATPEWYKIGFRRSTTVHSTSDDFSENLRDFVKENDDIADNMFTRAQSDRGGGLLTPTPSTAFQPLSRKHMFSLVAQKSWKNLSLSRSRELSKRNPRRSTAALLQREAAFSCSLAMASFQSALRRSTLAPPTVTDDMFAEEVSHFIEEHEKLQEDTWKAIEELAPTVRGLVCSL